MTDGVIQRTSQGSRGNQGEIPSNVDPKSGRISYGATAGRVDADLWFVIGCGEYWRATGDDAFLERMLPAFHPVIRPVDEDWEELQMSFSYTFKNQPYEYHNGGLWPIITGFYVADLAMRGQRDRTQRFLDAIHDAKALEMDGESWSFPEYVNGDKLTPEGTRHQGWSAAAAVIGYAALKGQSLFRI